MPLLMVADVGRATCIGDHQIPASAKHIICDARCYFTD
jgi:hypothetical protein